MAIDFGSIQIEAGIELPARVNVAKPSKAKEKLQAMEVGDSFFVPFSAGKTVRELVMRSAKSAEVKLSSRKLAEGFRFWRVA